MLTNREIEFGFDYYFKDDPKLDCLTEVSMKSSHQCRR